MLTFALPPNDAVARGRVAVAALPLADCLLALTLIAHEREGTARLAALRDRLTGGEARAVAEWFAPPLPLGLLALPPAVAHPDDPARVLAALRDAPDTDTVAYALALTGTRPPDAPASPGVYQSLIADDGWARAYVGRYLVPPPAGDAARSLLALIADPAATRRRLADALAGLVAAHLDALLPDLAAWGADAAARLAAVWRTTPAQFASRHIPVALGSVDTLTCFPSAFLDAGSVAFTPPDGAATLIAIGADDVPRDAEPEPVAPISAEAATYQDVYRLLADPVRWEIVRLLVAAPRYGQELAERLGLSVATVSHHLNTLKKLDLVTLERIEHRLYYDLRTDRLRALLAGASLGLFDDGGTE